MPTFLNLFTDSSLLSRSIFLIRVRSLLLLLASFLHLAKKLEQINYLDRLMACVGILNNQSMVFCCYLLRSLEQEF